MINSLIRDVVRSVGHSIGSIGIGNPLPFREDLNFYSKSRSGLTLIDDYGNNATLLPGVAQFNTSGTVNLVLTTPITLTTGEIILHGNQAYLSAGGGLYQGGGGTNWLNVRNSTTIYYQIQSVFKTFSFPSIPTTGINIFRIVITNDGTTKVRIYLNGVESTTGQVNYGASLTVSISTIGSHAVNQISYVNIISGTTPVLTMYPLGKGPYEYNLANTSNNGTWSATPTTVYLAGASTYLMDYGFSIYEKPGVADQYVPYGGSTTYLTGTLDYQLKETFAGNLTKYNLAPALIQFSGATFDRSNTDIWEDAARTGYYDATSATTKKRWHSSELNQYYLHNWAKTAYKDIIFTKYQDYQTETGRILQEIFCYNYAKPTYQAVYNYTKYKGAVIDLTSAFTVNTISGDLTWTDSYNGTAYYQIWRSVNNRTRTLVGTTALGATSFSDTTCKQAANIKYFILPIVNGKVCAYNSSTVFQSPFCFKTDQSTLTQVKVTYLVINSGTTVINWGDGNTTSCTVGTNSNKTHDYASTGQYNIWLTGDLNGISQIDIREQSTFYGDITNWVSPKELYLLHAYSCNFSGDVTDHGNYFTDIQVTYVINNNNASLTGDISAWRFAGKAMRDVHFENTAIYGDITNWTFPVSTEAGPSHWVLPTPDIYGDISDWTIPEGTTWLAIDGRYVYCDMSKFYVPNTLTVLGLNSQSSGHTSKIYGDMSNFAFPTTTSAYDVGITISNTDVIGDLSGINIPVFTRPVNLTMSYNYFTKLFRGDYKWIKTFDFQYNYCNSTEIDAWLSYVDNYFTGGVVPMTNAVYYVSGTNMGTPSAAGLASRTSIINKYVAAGFTCTITVNT